jgi:6-phosphogluconolactonase
MTTTAQRDVIVLPDAAALTQRGANEFLKAVDEAVSQEGTITVALSGGSTPRLCTGSLRIRRIVRKFPGQNYISFTKLHFFFGDERHVPPDHHDSNFNMANEVLFSKGVVRAEQITRIKGE